MTHLETCSPVPAGAAPARPLRKGIVLALACAAQGMVGVDIAIVNVALPSIQRDIGVGQSMLQWIVVAYALLLGGFLLLGGRMADRLGRRRIFLAGLTVFGVASLVAGVAGEAWVLIAARAVQGFGAALIAPAALSLLAVTFAEGPDRARAFGVFGAVGGLAGTLGVVASGLLTDGPGWRWAFLINVPIGIVLIALGLAFLQRDRPVDRTQRLDVAGAATVTAGLLLFVYALHHAADHGWVSWSTLGLFAAAVALLIVFVRIEARATAPLIPAATLRNRSLVVANLTGFFATCAFLSFIFTGSLLMQQALGYTPTETGLAWLATTVVLFVTSMVGGRLAGFVDGRWLLTIGLALFVVGILWLTRAPADGGFVADLLPSFVLAGIGFGLFAPALQVAALSGVSGSAAGLASGLLETMREIGGAAGVAVVSTVLVLRPGLGGFHTAFSVIAALAVVGLVIAAVGFTRRRAA